MSLALSGLLAACVTTTTPEVKPTFTGAVTPSATVKAAAEVTATLTAVQPTTIEPSATPVPPTATAQPTATPQTHVVQAGETLFRIALNAGVTVEALRAANGLTSDTIFVGQVLIIPGGIPAESPTDNPPPTSTAGVTAPAQATGAATTASGAASATPTAAASPIAVNWDTNPQALVIRAYSDCCELAPYDANFYIPDAQIWGDGHIIWVGSDGAGGRTVLTGQLSHEQLQSLLQAFVDEGFFGWQDNYQTYIGAALRPTHITVTLKGVTKTVTQLGGAPDAYYALFNSLKVGAGALPNPYVPTQGYLTAKLFDPNPGTAPEWPAATAGFTLDQVGTGRYVEGDTLAFAWAQVNKGPAAPVYVQSNGQVYVIMIQIPGVSLYPPP